jgi:hypothetical protein
LRLDADVLQLVHELLGVAHRAENVDLRTPAMGHHQRATGGAENGDTLADDHLRHVVRRGGGRQGRRQPLEPRRPLRCAPGRGHAPELRQQPRLERLGRGRRLPSAERPELTHQRLDVPAPEDPLLRRGLQREHPPGS